jgi:hypothetical protein
MKNNKFQKGDKIRIDADGEIITGTIESAVDWGDEIASDWYIEFRNDDDGLICYTKERYDREKIFHGNLTITKL